MESPMLPFAGPISFLGARTLAPGEMFAGKVGVLGFPSDAGSTWMPGTRFGPRSLREVSLRFARSDRVGRAGFWDIESGRRTLDTLFAEQQLVDCGDVRVLPNDLEATIADGKQRVEQIVEGGGIPVVLGGDHAITHPVVRSLDGSFTVIQIDAHMDYSPFANGYRFSHAHPFRLIAALPQVEKIIHVGIRSFRTTQTDVEDAIADGNSVVSGGEVKSDGGAAVLHHLDAVDRAYVSLDIDVLDGYLVPGVSAPEPGGLSVADVSDLLHAIATNCKVIGCDVCEVNPLLDLPSRPTAFLAVQLVVSLLSYIEDSRSTFQPARGSI